MMVRTKVHSGAVPSLTEQQSVSLEPATAMHGETVREANLAVRVDGRSVPTVAWLPADRPPTAVVLLGHGGSGHKRTDRNVRLATWLATRAGLASLAIDGPFHGDRAIGGAAPLDYQRMIVEQGAQTVHDQMCEDWLAALSAADRSGMCNEPGVAYLGMSMGARYGIPLCAALGPRLRCAVLGKFGTTHSDQLPPGLDAGDHIRAAARQIHAPVLFHVQWNDEVFPLAGQLALFASFSSPYRVLRGRPGGHAHTHRDDERAWLNHLTTFLGFS